jgi:hypothetical protein
MEQVLPLTVFLQIHETDPVRPLSFFHCLPMNAPKRNKGTVPHRSIQVRKGIKQTGDHLCGIDNYCGEISNTVN